MPSANLPAKTFHSLCLSSVWVFSEPFLCKSTVDTLSLNPKDLRPQGLYSSWNSPGQNTGVGGLSLLQGVFPTQGSNPGLPHCKQIIYQLSHWRSIRILEWVAYLCSSTSSQPRNQTQISCIAGRFFTSWATREALKTYDWTIFSEYIFNRKEF